jgi:hypothetical protein
MAGSARLGHSASSPHVSATQQLEATFQRLLDEELSILQRAAVLHQCASGRWDAWGAALLEEVAVDPRQSAPAFPQESVLRMFTEEVPVDMQRIPSRPQFPDIDWDELRCFVRSVNLDHMWERVGATQRAVLRIREIEAQKLRDQAEARHGHRDITSFLSKGKRGQHIDVTGAQPRDDLPGENGGRGNGRIVDALHALKVFRPHTLHHSF